VPGLSALPEALTAAGASADQASAASAALAPVLKGAEGELRVSVQFEGRPGGLALASLEARRSQDGAGATMVRSPSGDFIARPLATDVRTAVKAVRGEMDANSFYTSAVAAGVTDSLISPFAQAFAFDFDFQREIKPGDIFEAVFEHPVDADGRAAGGDRLLYAALQTATKSRALYRFKPPSGGGEGWFDANGRSIVRSLMRTPVEGARISSTFGMRFHPVLGYTRMHKGVDFAVAVGTPVYASGDGVIDFMGPHDGHGNFVKIRHNPTLETGYAHLSKFGDGLQVGSPVRQGQEIALSGNTGLSSGPHMHYEVIVNGEPVDPLSFQTESGRNLAGADLVAFDKVRDRIDAQRAAQTG
jgi:murein DD-endopeptidase MepM/ murein hydrolase activator NlpD